MELGLGGRVALVTGGSAGLGWGAARALAEEGADVAICARGAERLAAAEETLRSLRRGRAASVVGDVSKADEPSRIVGEVERRFGPVEILVANAGGPPPGRFPDVDEQDWEVGFQRTLMSAVRLVRAVLPNMTRSRFGRIVFITSTSVKQPIDGLILSNVFRPGVVGLAKSLANELAPDGITVNCVCPGPFQTDRIVELFADRAKRAGIDPEEAKRRYLANVPAGRLGDPIELGRAIAFLASDQAAYLTGVSLSIDGGSVRGLFG